MGCCPSCEENKEDDVDNPNRPLINPIGDGSTSGSGIGYHSTAERSQQKGDEQSALNRILQETASSVIDVGALDAQPMDQHEYLDRSKHYSTRLSAWCSSTSRHRGLGPLPAGVAAPLGVLSSQPVTLADVQLITNAAQKVSRSLRDVKVKHKEDLVVPFGVP